jgi:phosphorylase/glycogen(starch) synthase
MTNTNIKPEFIFETSWEVCNKVGGIYTVLSTKYEAMQEVYPDNYFFIGPDVWKETRDNPAFTEDKKLFANWRESSEKEGLRIRAGHWNIPGNPIAILVDFTSFFANKDEIFASFWETYKLDSLSGGWDYIEPALFGYAAGKVVESYCNFFLDPHDHVIAHFHEWMTGAGVLYIEKNLPQVGTVFTTHATALGRSMAGNNLPLYSQLDKINPVEMAKKLGITSKFSLEKNAALHADCFTTVSDITAQECKYFFNREVDEVTPNGFADSFVPQDKKLPKQKATSRKNILNVAQAVLNQKLDDETFLMLTSGRYEFGNKGLDAFIDVLGKLNQEKELKRKVLAIVAVPADHRGPIKEVADQLSNPDFNNPRTNHYLTHHLHDTVHDPVIKRILENNLNNGSESKIKVLFVPVYLDSKDGIFNIDYYEFLNAFDLTLFPSFYEPWGYTPMESIAYGVPTITTSLAGFGLWVKNEYKLKHDAVSVIDRTENNYNEFVNEITAETKKLINLSKTEYQKTVKESLETVKHFNWNILKQKYMDAYELAISKSYHKGEFERKQSVEYTLKEAASEPQPDWKKFYIRTNIPTELQPLKELSMNLWWSWNHEVVSLFESIDPERWEETGHNPVALLNKLTYSQLQKLKTNEDFMAKLEVIYKAFTKYMSMAHSGSEELVGYFSMEYGLHESLKIYSGGLGVLAGDYLKQASDSNKNMLGIGLMYRYGYFNQNITHKGDQFAESLPQKYTDLPLIPVRDENDEWVKISLALPGRTLLAKAWKVMVGRIPLYLLDTDISENSVEDRSITHNLYGGDWHNRFKQELVLGVGGVRLLYELNLRPKVYHLNEGHAAFAGLERLRHLVESRGLSFRAAKEVIRSTSLFTTHTPVPAGHDTFTEDILRTYIPHYADRLHISWDEFMALGRFNKDDRSEKFSMSVLAAKNSQLMNGVSKLHGKVSRQMFEKLYPGYFATELHIDHVTNGVHMPTWTAANWQRFYLSKLGNEHKEDQSNPGSWSKIHKLSDSVIWKQRNKAKKEFLNYLKEKLVHDLKVRHESPKTIYRVLDEINDKALYIGFARRFATYKRAHLLFTNMEKLSELVNNPDKPLRFIFAGKAHPNDIPGQDLIKRVVEISRMEEFMGKIIFLENYDMAVARKLVSGVDIWLNTPTRPLEASGTSGEKAVMNGVLNLSVLDGWWAEGYRKDAGWAIPEAKTYGNQQFQDELDAETIYQFLEDDILPVYFDVDSNGVPHKWVGYIKNNISQIVPHFTMKRMLDDYYDKFYSKLFEQAIKIKSNNYQLAGEIEHWKSNLESKWPEIKVTSVRIPDSSIKPLDLGDEFAVDVTLDINGINSDDIGIEIVIGKKVFDKMEDIYQISELEKYSMKGSSVSYKCALTISESGVFDFAFRIYPKSEYLAHRQDFNLVKWI